MSRRRSQMSEGMFSTKIPDLKVGINRKHDDLSNLLI